MEELQPERDLSQNPLFQVMFALQNAPFSARRSCRGCSSSPSAVMRPPRASTSRCTSSSDEDGCAGVFVYNADLFDAATVELLGRQWLTLLEGGSRASGGEDRGLAALRR